MDIAKIISPNRNNFQRIIEDQLFDYINYVYRRWNSNIFPSSSLAKIIIKNLNESPKKYRLIHKNVKQVLNNWSKKGICKLIGMTSLPSGKKTKFIYQFKMEKMEPFQISGSMPLQF